MPSSETTATKGPKAGCYIGDRSLRLGFDGFVRIVCGLAGKFSSVSVVTIDRVESTCIVGELSTIRFKSVSALSCHATECDSYSYYTNN